MSTPPSLESLNAAISVLAQQVTQLNNQVNTTPEANFAPFEIRNPTTGHIAQVSHEDPLALLKTINDYDGNPNLLNHWLNKARRINQIFFATDSDTQQKQGHYYTFLLGLESKIIGPAQEVLAKNNYEANFSLMEKLLIEAFGEKKKIEHLLYEIITAEQHGKNKIRDFSINNKVLYTNNDNTNEISNRFKDNNTVLSYENFNHFKDNNEVLSNENFNHFKDNEVLNNENFNHINCEIYNNYNNNEKSNHSNNSNMRTNSSSNNFSVIES
ncbi:GATA zinc finger domain-containing protein 15-like [Toxorhynchites rutilus septentrionalis]|uniref:GATA zinc finger domain-containing protein 15-like n=1 Tax=Toxorhynchites rutilus septentrionalis TaxID=329112 RepID=UPI00247B0621|nr:GATA zinc finger domain-containing protein 15-like [Toxorhynchites rutilus septentrionalis]